MSQCAWINVPNCPYTLETAHGCPFQEVKDLEAPEHCVLIQSEKMKVEQQIEADKPASLTPDDSVAEVPVAPTLIDKILRKKPHA